ncbi:MAG: tetratricopeptide repeat protein [Spirochaetales bacterium]|nr:tetratricopeptide repeat protein [Spirochaetales bacterium]
MKFSSNVKKIIFLSAGFLLILSVTFGSFFIYKGVIRKRRQEKFSLVLTEAAELLSEGYSTEAEDLLESLTDVPVTSVEHMKLLKQYYNLAVITDDFSRFSALSISVAEKFPGREDIKAVGVWGLLKSGRYEAAFEKSGELTNELYNSLTAETLLRYKDKLNLKIVAERGLQGNPYLNVMTGRDPDIFIHAGEQTGIATYYLDGTLLYMEQGRIRRAQSVFRNYLGDDHPYLGLLINMDGRRWETALRMLNLIRERGETKPEIELLYGDILLHQEKIIDAEVFYSEYIRSNPSEFYLPYANLHLIKKSRDRADGSILKQGLEYFPMNSELSILYAAYLIDSGDDVGAERVLEDISGLDENNYRAELALVNLLSGHRTPEYVRGRYWDLINRYDGSMEPVKSFALYLMAWSIWDEFDLLLSRYERDWGETGWSNGYRGVAAAIKGNFTTAATLLEKSVELEETPEALYNLGVLNEKSGYYKRAEDLLEMAIVALDESEIINIPFEGRMKTRLGIILYKNMKYDRAIIEINSGLELVPAHLEGIFYQRLINEEVQ